MAMRACELFGKRYFWHKPANGPLELLPEAELWDAPMGPVTFNDVLRELGRIEEQADVGR